MMLLQVLVTNAHIIRNTAIPFYVQGDRGMLTEQCDGDHTGTLTDLEDSIWHRSFTLQ